jgi:peptide/nickel transport system substrate-binding protein
MAEHNYWTRRVSRRAALRGAGVAGAGLAGAALIGCGGGDEDIDTGPAPGTTPATTAVGGTPIGGVTGDAGQPQSGGTLTFAIGTEPRSLDPHFDVFIPMRMGYNVLTRFTQDLSAHEPELAESLPEVPDDSTYVYKLRKGVKFHNVDPANGREFVAEDVKFSIERQMTDEAGKFQHAYYFKDRVVDIQTPDDHTVIFKTDGPYAPFQNYVSSPWSLMVNREAVEKFGDLTQNVVGTGPFILDEWQKEVHINWRKNPDYFVEGQPFADKLNMPVVTDADAQATLFLDRKIDAVTTTFARRDRVKQGRPDAVTQSVPSQFWRQFRMPPTQETDPYPAPFDDIRVRQAIVQAINKQEGLDLVYSGDGMLTFGPILPQFEFWALKDELAPFDLDNSKKLLEAAGNPTIKGPMMWAASPEADQIAEVLKQQLGKLGVTLDLEAMETAAYYNKNYTYEYTFSHHVPLNSPDPDENLSSYFGRNSTYFKHYNPEIFDMVDQQATLVDREERQQVVMDVQKKIVEDYPMRFMWTVNVHQFLDPKVKGWWYSLDRYENYWAPAWVSQQA